MTLTLGTPTTATGLASGTVCDDWKFVQLTTDKAVYIYWDSGLSDVVGRVVTSSGTSISTIGSATSIITESTAFRSWRPVRMSSTGFVVIYGLATGGIRAVACTVSGTTISAGTHTSIDASADINTTDDVFGARVDDNKAVAVYMDRNNSTRGTATAFTVSGTSIASTGSPHVYESTGGNQYMGADAFGDGTHVLATHIRSNTVYAICLSVSGTTVSSGSEISMSGGSATKRTARAVGLASADGFVIWEQTSGAQAGKVRAVSRSGTTLTASSTTVDWATDTSANIPKDACRMADDLALLIFLVSNTNKEQAIEIQLSSGEPSAGTALDLDSPADNLNMGIAKANTTTAMVIYKTDQIAILSTDLVSSAFRLLGLAADTEQVYIAGLKDSATLQLYTYSDLDSLTEGGTIHAFGSASDTDIDNLAKGIYPVVRPGADKVVYLRGRDGSDVHVQKNDLNGAGGWQDLDDGGWAAAKFAVALMPNILDPDDLIAAFDDNDVYRSQDDGANWTKTGDAPTNLRGGARHPITDNELLLAGTTAGDPHYSHNFGASFAAAADDDIIQTEEVRVAAGADDGYVNQGASTFNDSLVNFSFGQISGNDVDAWVRFDGVTVPQGATITAAYIEFVADSTRAGSMTADIYGEDADDPAAPSSVADFNGRTRTTATVNWNPGDWTDGETYQTDDIKTIIQEIVDRGSWASGNAMQLFVERSTGTVRRVAKAYEGSTTQAALLHIEYQVTGLINAIEYSL